MTDHLEQYRRLVRSMRFFPPMSLDQPSIQPVAQPVIPALGVNLSSRKTNSEAQEISALSPPIDPSERAATLIHEAVTKPTVLPVTYAIPENIGDRISRLAKPKPVESIVIQPKIPQPDANAILAPTIEPQPMKADEKEPVEASAPSMVRVAPPSVTQTPSNDAVAMVAQPAAIEQTTDEQAVDVVVDQPVEVEQTPPEEEIAGVTEPVALEETSEDTLDNNTSTEVVSEPVVIAETTLDNITDTDAPVAEEEAKAPTLLEKVSSAIAAVSNILKNSEPDESPTVSEASAADTVEPLKTDASTDEAPTNSTPNLLERVSAVVEAVATTLTNPNADKKDAEAAVESGSQADEETRNSQTVDIEVTCPECHSSDIRKNGRRQNKQRYICKDCGRQFVTSSVDTLEDSSEIKASSNVKTPDAKGSQVSTAVSGSTSKSSKRHSKKKTKPKGFGDSKAN